MKRLSFQLILLFNFLVLFSQDYSPKSSGEIITHNYYSLSYNEYHEQANWVHYKLRNALILGTAVRKDNFRADYNVSTKSASPYDYKSTGYDRGHLAPAGDMKITFRRARYVSKIENTPQIFRKCYFGTRSHVP